VIVKIKGNALVVVSICYYLVRATSMSEGFGKQRIRGELRGSKQVCLTRAKSGAVSAQALVFFPFGYQRTYHNRGDAQRGD
jgi:hypothetical protein